MIYLQGSIALIIFAYLLFKSYLLSVFFLILYCSFLYLKKQKSFIFKLLIPIILISIHYMVLSRPYVPSEKITGVIIESKAGYYQVLDSSFHKYQIYTEELYGLGDLIEVKGSYTTIHSLANFDIFCYSTYLNRQGIYYSYSNPVITLRKEAMIGKIGKKIKGGSNVVLNYFLFSGYEEKGDYEAIFISSGLHFAVIFSWLFRFLILYTTEIEASNIVLIFKTIITFLFPNVFALRRLLINDLLRKTRLSRFQRIYYASVLILVIEPSRVFSLAFLIPFIFNITNIFLKNHQFSKSIIMIPIQLYITKSLSIIYFIIYPLFSRLYTICFILSFLSFDPITSYFTSKYFNFLHLLNNIVLNPHLNIMLLNYNLVVCLLCISMIMFKSRKIWLIIILLSVWISGLISPFTKITMLDVGQGDAVLVEYPYKKGNILIDTGGNKYRDLATEIIIPTLNKKGIKKLNLLFLTHDDFDHTGASESLISNFKVEQIIDETSNQTIIVDDNNKIVSYKLGAYEEDNANSIILLFKFPYQSYFTAGDIPTYVEDKIRRSSDLGNVDICKLSHHGSNTSNSKAFLGYLKPKIVLNSSGYHNYYGHPSTDVLKTLNDLNLHYYDTQDLGAIELILVYKWIIIRSARLGLCGIVI